MPFPEAPVAVIGPPMKSVTVAAELRRAGIVTETFLKGTIKKQLGKAADKECAVILFSDKTVVKDLWTGRQKEITDDQILTEVKEVLLNGYYDPDESLEDFKARIFNE